MPRSESDGQILGFLSNSLPLRMVWLSGVWQLIGGGPPMMATLLFIMVADACPAGKMLVD